MLGMLRYLELFLPRLGTRGLRLDGRFAVRGEKSIQALH